ncbi:hypothetical protein V8C40DRAFT_250753 [Trichoderma camerunense]
MLPHMPSILLGAVRFSGCCICRSSCCIGACDRRSWQHYPSRRRKLAAAKHSLPNNGVPLLECGFRAGTLYTSLCPQMPCGVGSLFEAGLRFVALSLAVFVPTDNCTSR